MRPSFVHAISTAALLALACYPTVGKAVAIAGPPNTPPGDYYVSLDNGGYTPVGNSDPFAGGDIFIDPGLPGIASPNIVFGPPLSLDFDLLQPGQGPLAGDKWQATIEDSTGTDELLLVLDGWSSLLAGADGATIDPATEVVLVANTSDVLADNLVGTLDVPAPAALPVLVTALSMLGVFRRRAKRASAAG